MAKIAEAYVEISARLDKMNADLTTAKAQFAKATGDMQKQATGLGSSMKGLYDKALLLRAGYAAVAYGIGAAIKSTADHLDQLDEMSVKTGVSVEMLTSLELAAKQNGVSMQQLATSIRMMYRSMNEAAGGSKEAAEAYKRIGVNVKDSSGQLKSGNEAFLEVADAISKIQNPAERSAMAMKVFGRAGAEMLPMLEGGRDALKGYIEEAKRLGIVFTDADAKRAARFNDVLDAFSARLRAIKERLALEVLPVLTDFMMLMTGEMTANKDMDPGFKNWAENAGRVVKHLAAGKPMIEAFALASYETGVNMATAAAEAGKFDEAIKKRKQDKLTFTMDVTAPKYDPAKEGGSRIASRMRAASGLPPQESPVADMLMQGIQKVNPQIGQMKIAVGELIGAFAEVEPTIIDTRVKFEDLLVAPFEDMMSTMQGAWADTISEFLRGGQSFGEFMSNMFGNVLNSFVQMVSQMAAYQLASGIFGAVTGLQYNPAGVGPNYARMQAAGGTTININAVDAQSFAQAVRRNPAAILETVYEAQRYGRTS